MQQGRILIAEDDALLRLDLRTLLESMGHCIVGEAANGEEVCHLARSLHPDLTLLDVRMPRMDGLEAAEVLSRERLGPVLLLTAYSDLPTIERANRAGVLAYLVKPYREADLQASVEIALSRYREMRALENALDSAQEQAETSRAVGRAKRVLMERHELSDQEAYRRIQAQALASQRTLREVAEAVLLADEMMPPRPAR